jgi:hypothetical protein
MRRFLCIAVVSCLALVAGCGSDDGGGDSTTSATATQTTPTQTTTDESTTKLPHGSEPVKLDPADFTTKIDNPYYPLAPNDRAGRRWIYQSTEERIVVTVTEETKDIQGVTARVITDVVTNRNGGGFVEVTKDWYSQDKDGNVWYLGEDTKEYENGKVASTKGSWEHGVNGAYGGIIMPADPQPGQTYRQEYYKGEAEDRAKVVTLDARVTVPFGTFENALKTADSSPLEPGAVEFKYYAKGVGHVLRTSEDGGGREELISFKK